MNWLKQNWFKLVIIIVVLIIVGGVFYWFQWRPAQIRKECAVLSEGKGSGFNLQEFLAKYGSQEARDNLYKQCLREHGLEK